MRETGVRHRSLLGVVSLLIALTLAQCDRIPPTRESARIDLIAAAAAQHKSSERCDVGGDSRDSLVLAPGETVSLSLPVPSEGHLRYALATTGGGATEASLQLRVADGQNGTPLSHERRATAERWAPDELDLSRFGGRTVVLQASVTSEGNGATAKLCWAHPVVASRDHTGPLVVVVLLDTVRRDRLALYGHTRPNTPGLEALAHDGLVFDDMTSDAPWTRASVATLFTGQGSLTHGVLARDAHLEPRWPTLAQRFRRAGFSTVAFSSNPNVLPFWGFASGFDRFVDVGAESWTENSDAANVLDAGLAASDDAGSGPLLLYLHLNDVHAPYDPPPFEATALLGHYDPASPGRVLTPTATPAELQGALERYDAEIAYLDAQLGHFDEELRRRGRYDDAAIVVVGDHGEEFLDHGGVYHGHSLFREVLDVPLVMKLPKNRGAGTRVAAPTTMRDVLPTLLTMLGLPSDDLPGRVVVTNDGRPTDGASLPRFAATDMDLTTAYGVELDGLSLIIQTRPRGGTWVFDRRADPHERTNVAGTMPMQKTAVLQKLLDERLLAARAGWHVRACGGPRPSTATIHLSSAAPLAPLERIDFEADDRVEVAPAATELTWKPTLAPQTRDEEFFGKLVPVTRADRDELVFGNPGPLTLTYDGGATVLVGGSAHAVPAGTLTVSVTEADAPAVFAPVCPAEPTLLVWHAGSATAGAPADPDLARRLKAIGYLQ